MTSAAYAGMPEPGSGDRAREAREAAGLTAMEVATRMRVPLRVVESLEAEDWARLGAPVFVRGQLRSYGRVLGLPADALLPMRSAAPIEPPQLQPRTFTPRYQRIAEQAARRMVYVVITATLAVPVWMVTRGHIDGAAPQTASLDLVSDPSTVAQDPEGSTQSPVRQRPLVASMAPVQTRRPALAAGVALTAPVPTAADDVLTLHFNQDSWVDVRDASGARIEQALVRAGQRRQYAAGEVGQVVLGNAGAVEVRRGDDVQDLSPYRRANVARFTVSSDGSLAAASE